MDLVFQNKFARAIYLNGKWIMDPGLIQDTSETPVDNPSQESINKNTDTQNKINKENASIIGQNKILDVDEQDNLIDASNWLYDNKLEQIRLRINSAKKVINDFCK